MSMYKMHIDKINIENKIYDYHFKNLIKGKHLKAKNILLDEEKYKDFRISFTRYVHKNILWLMIIY